MRNAYFHRYLGFVHFDSFITDSVCQSVRCLLEVRFFGEESYMYVWHRLRGK
jgi:hypothetical protein